MYIFIENSAFPIDVFLNCNDEISVVKHSQDADPVCVCFSVKNAEEICNAILDAAISAGAMNGAR